MSEYLRTAREHLRTAVTLIDTRLAEIQLELVSLGEQRRALVEVIGGEAAASLVPPPSILGEPPAQPSEVRHVNAAPAPAARRASSPAPVLREHLPASPRDKHGRLNPSDAEVLRVLAEAGEPIAFRALVKAVGRKFTQPQVKRSCARLLQTGSVLREGRTLATRYSLPSGRAKRGIAAAPPAGQGKPADDDGHGVDAVTSVPAHAGVSGSLSDVDHPPANSRPPVSVAPSTTARRTGQQPLAEQVSRSASSFQLPASGFAISNEVEKPEVVDLPPDDKYANSGRKGSISHRPDNSAAGEAIGGFLDDPDEDDFTLSENPGLSEVDDLQAELDAQPAIRKRPGPKPKYKPGHRQEAATSAPAAPSPSWWTRPDADFAAEAERMRLDPKQKKVPGETNIICMNGAF